MPLLYADLNSVRKTISGLAADFKSPRKLPWRIEDKTSTSESSLKIRAWDASTKDDHKCWILFEAAKVERGTAVEVSICQKLHYVGKFLSASLDTLLSLHGSPPQKQAEQTTLSGPAAAAPTPVRPSVSPAARPPARPPARPLARPAAARPKLHPAFVKRPPNQR